MLLNVGFALTVVIALVLLLAAAGVSWYGDHLSSAATVNGQSISKDAYQKQLAVNAFRTDYQARRIRTLLTAGHLRTADAQARQAVLDQRNQNASTIALEQLIDGDVMEQLASGQGVSVTDADVDAKLAEEATTPEMRHAWMIAVAPELATGETAATDAEKAAAKAKADQALADLKAGKAWDEVAKAVSTDPSKDQGGDLGFIDDSAALDQPFVDALVAAAKDAPTAVIEGQDGIYRIGRVSEIVTPLVDATFSGQVSDAGIDMNDFRAALRRDVLRTRLYDGIVAKASQPGPQRNVAEIYLAADQDGKDELAGALRIRHILYSPNDDTQAATSLAADDPAWAAAEAEARAAYAKVSADPNLFDGLARTDNDDSGSTSTGGRYWFSKDDPLDPAFSAAIFKDGLQPGQVLQPVKSSFGWHVIQILRPAPDSTWITKLKSEADAGTDFATLARDNSDGAEASKGGDLGWVYKGELSKEVEDAIFAAPVGKVSEPLAVDGDGRYLFKVTEEATRPLDPDQLNNVKQTAFSSWYQQQKDGFTITRDPSITAPTSQ
jgi:parvulin-like peptidyl-prolyl isomerase